MDRLYRVPRKGWAMAPLVALVLVAWLIKPGADDSRNGDSRNGDSRDSGSSQSTYPPTLITSTSSFPTVSLPLTSADGVGGLHSDFLETHRIPFVDTARNDGVVRHTPHIAPVAPELSHADNVTEPTPATLEIGSVASLRRTPVVEQNSAPAQNFEPLERADAVLSNQQPSASHDAAHDGDLPKESHSALLDIPPPPSESLPPEPFEDGASAAASAIPASQEGEPLGARRPAQQPEIASQYIAEEQVPKQHPPIYRMSEQQLTALANTADRIIEAGSRLAERGATYSARAEFVMALRMTAQGIDAYEGGKRHSEALSAAFRAMRESEGFTPHGVNMEADINLAILIAAHRTPVLKSVDTTNLTPMVAIQAYYTYAQNQFAVAGGHVAAASHALFSLGKLQQSKHGAAQGQKLQAAKAMAFHQSALLVDTRNHRAANELGVLLAQYEQWDDARRMLLHSVSAFPMAETWHNLAAVHERLGQTDLARRAKFEEGLVHASQNAARPNPHSTIRWISPEQFVKTNPRPAGATRQTAPPAQSPRSAARPAKSKKKWGWW